MKKIIITATATFIATLACYAKDDSAQWQGYVSLSQGNLADNIVFAKNMGYKNIRYEKNLVWTQNPALRNCGIYFENPENFLFDTFKRDDTVGTKERDLISKYALVANPDAPFPLNIACANGSSPEIMKPLPDFSNPKVIDAIINKAKLVIGYIEKSKYFDFIGIAWNDISADCKFQRYSGGKLVDTPISFYIKDTAKLEAYKKGKLEYIKRLTQEIRKNYPNAKIIVSCNRISNLAKVVEEIGADFKPDMILQSKRGTEFTAAATQKPFAKGTVFGTITSEAFDDGLTRKIYGTAAATGSVSALVGKIGGEGQMPAYDNIRDIPARIALQRVIPLWENINKTPLSERSFKNGVYVSSTAGISEDAVWGMHPDGRMFFVIVTPDGSVKIPNGLKVDKISATNGLFEEIKGKALASDVEIKDGVIKPTSPAAYNEAFIVHFKK